MTNQAEREAMETDPWTIETMRLINELTPDIAGKAFDPDWFLLRQRFEKIEKDLKSIRLSALQECAKLVCPHCARGDVRQQGNFHAPGDSQIYACYADEIHAKIKQMEERS